MTVVVKSASSKNQLSLNNYHVCYDLKRGACVCVCVCVSMCVCVSVCAFDRESNWVNLSQKSKPYALSNVDMLSGSIPRIKVYQESKQQHMRIWLSSRNFFSISSCYWHLSFLIEPPSIAWGHVVLDPFHTLQRNFQRNKDLCCSCQCCVFCSTKLATNWFLVEYLQGGPACSTQICFFSYCTSFHHWPHRDNSKKYFIESLTIQTLALPVKHWNIS